MKLFRYTFLLTCTFCLLFVHYSAEGSQTTGNQGNEITAPKIEPQAFEVIGKTYTITIYPPFTDNNNSTISFFDDGFLQFSAFNGFGTYAALGNFFWGSYWTTNLYDTGVLIFFSGLSYGPFISAIGTVSDFRNTVLWFCLGHEN
jgi:hypothetical protein